MPERHSSPVIVPTAVPLYFVSSFQYASALSSVGTLPRMRSVTASYFSIMQRLTVWVYIVHLFRGRTHVSVYLP